MQFIKNFFNHDKTIIGLSSLRKRPEYVRINVNEKIKKTHITDISHNYFLI